MPLVLIQYIDRFQRDSSFGGLVNSCVDVAACAVAKNFTILQVISLHVSNDQLSSLKISHSFVAYFNVFMEKFQSLAAQLAGHGL